MVSSPLSGGEAFPGPEEGQWEAGRGQKWAGNSLALGGVETSPEAAPTSSQGSAPVFELYHFGTAEL